MARVKNFSASYLAPNVELTLGSMAQGVLDEWNGMRAGTRNHSQVQSAVKAADSICGQINTAINIVRVTKQFPEETGGLLAFLGHKPSITKTR